MRIIPIMIGLMTIPQYWCTTQLLTEFNDALLSPFPGGGTQQMAQVARKPNTGIRTDKVATISVSSKPQHQKRQGPLTITEALQTQPVST